MNEKMIKRSSENRKSHTPPVSIDTGMNAIAYFSLNAPENLMLFLQGSDGSALDSWGQIPLLAPEIPEFNTSDIVFYGYECLREKAKENALRISRFIQGVTEGRRRVVGNFRSGRPKYTKITITAHSSCADVIRLALRNATESKEAWVDKVTVLFYTNSLISDEEQSGSSVSLPGIGQVISGIGLIRFPGIKQADAGQDIEQPVNNISDTGDEIKEALMPGSMEWNVQGGRLQIEWYGSGRPMVSLKERITTSIQNQNMPDLPFPLGPVLETLHAYD